MSERLDRDQSSLRIWLRIALATVVVVGLVVITGARDDPDTDSGFTPLDGRSAGGLAKRCGASEAKRVARLWFRGMISGEPKLVEGVTSRGKPVPRYVITVESNGGPRTVRIRTRAAAAETVPRLIGVSDAQRSLKIDKVSNPPRASDIRSPLSGRLAGIGFSARVGDTKWSGKMGVRCGNDAAYFAAFVISYGQAAL